MNCPSSHSSTRIHDAILFYHPLVLQPHVLFHLQSLPLFTNILGLLYSKNKTKHTNKQKPSFNPNYPLHLSSFLLLPFLPSDLMSFLLGSFSLPAHLCTIKVTPSQEHQHPPSFSTLFNLPQSLSAALRAIGHLLSAPSLLGTALSWCFSCPLNYYFSASFRGSFRFTFQSQVLARILYLSFSSPSHFFPCSLSPRWFHLPQRQLSPSCKLLS